MSALTSYLQAVKARNEAVDARAMMQVDGLSQILDHDVPTLTAMVERLCGALKFYANCSATALDDDGGGRAVEALEDVESMAGGDHVS